MIVMTPKEYEALNKRGSVSTGSWYAPIARTASDTLRFAADTIEQLDNK